MKQIKQQHLISIILAADNQLADLKLCIAGIYKYTEFGSYELIVVDNNSTDGTLAWLKQQANIIVIAINDKQNLANCYQQGTAAANGAMYLYLQPNIIVMADWLENLQRTLRQDFTIGAVIPRIEAICRQETELDESPNLWLALEKNAQAILQKQQARPKRVLTVDKLCVLVRKTVVDNLGLFDEQFTAFYLALIDYSIRLTLLDYKIIGVGDSFVYELLATGEVLKPDDIFQSRRYFKDKWKFAAEYSLACRQDIIEEIDFTNRDLKILEVGCACGATLLEIKNISPAAKVYGIELNSATAKIASKVAAVISADVEKTADVYPQQFFDYIILADILEHLHNPTKMLTILAQYLKPEGIILASIPNIMHYSIMLDLLQGNWSYADAGILDRTHLRFFTQDTISKMFKKVGFTNLYFQSVTVPYEQAKIAKLMTIMGAQEKRNFTTYQWLIKAKRDKLLAIDERELSFLLNRVANDIESLSALIAIVDMCNKGLTSECIFAVIKKNTINKIKVIIAIGVALFEHKLIQNSLEFMNLAVNEYGSDSELLYTQVFLLDLSGDKVGARAVLRDSHLVTPELQLLRQELEV